MERIRGFVSMLFQGEECLGEMLVVPQEDTDASYIQHLFRTEIRVSFVSPASERSLNPLAVLHTIAPTVGPCFKMCPTDEQLLADSLRLDHLYSSCLEESKTAVVLLENGNELHLVAMKGGGSGSSLRHRQCFWAFLASEGMYASCLGMLNLRCLAMVFDLDETLIVANTMRSFENRIEVLDRRVCGGGATDMDPLRRASMVAELKRYQEDRILLKQFVDNDQIFDDNGNIIEVQGEVVPPLADGALPLVRPIIRLPDRNMVLTRINPSVRDTSVLVRLRPAWEELRGYLIAKGRKRFEVFICTMAEREYALEMWRLLDPDAGLINSRELMERVVCVKSGNKKSLLNVFPHHRCHPNMAMVVDDRLKVWEESDQPRVHVVPAFAPYSAPQAESNTSLIVPALRVARNVACNVRASFFKQFDETLSQQMSEIQFETDVATLPSSPDVSTCLIAAEVRNNFGHLQSFRVENEDNMRLAVVNPLSPQSVAVQPPPPPPPPQQQQQQHNTLSHLLSANLISQSHPLNSEDSRQDVLAESYSTHGAEQLLQHQQHQQQQQPPPPLLRPLPNVMHVPNSSTQQGSSPAREEEGEVPESELDPDTRRRLMIFHYGMDTNNHVRELSNFDDLTQNFPGGKLASGAITSYSGAEEEMSPGRPTRSSAEQQQLALKPESPSFDTQHELQGPPGFVDRPFLSNSDRGGGGGGGGGGGSVHDPRRRLAPQQDSSSRFLSDELQQQQQQRSDGFTVEQQQQQRSFMSSADEDDQSRSLAAGLQQDLQLVHNPGRQQGPTNFVDVLQGIALKLNSTVEYKAILASSSTRLLFNVEVSFAGQKVGEGTGSTKKEARFRAAEAALWFLARQLSPPTNNNYQSSVQQQQQQASNSSPNSFLLGVDDDGPMLASQSRDSGRLHPPGLGGGMDMDYLELASTSGQVNFVATLKERCTVLGVNVNFQDLPTTGEAARRFFHCQVEVGGQVLGMGSGISWDIAKQHAAEEALRHLKRPGFKPIDTPRSPPIGAKRVRIGLPGSSPGRGRRGRGRGRSPPRRRPPGR